MRKQTFHFLMIVFISVVSLLTCQPIMAQVDMGTISGTVTDPSHAVVPEASVLITEVQTGITHRAQTNSSGGFTVSPLPIGEYTVSVERTGFRTAHAGPVRLNVQQTLNLNVQLVLGNVSQQVTVSGVHPQLETVTSSLGQVISSHQIVNLPLNGRNFAQLALLAAGTAPAEPGARTTTNFGFSSNGSRSSQNDYILDGVDDNSNLADLFTSTNYAIQPTVDAIAEFKVQTNGYSAEFSRGIGSVVNISTKSGTNRFHGDVWEFIRNDKVDASNFFAPSKPEFRQNQFGATLGGPILRNRLFFFGAYEGLRIANGAVQLGVVPTTAMRSGDYSSLLQSDSPLVKDSSPVLDCNGRPTYKGELFNTLKTQESPSSPTGLCGFPVGGYNAQGLPTNIIPHQDIDPAGQAIMNLYPEPNSTLSGENYISQPVATTTQNNYTIRIDDTISSKDSLFGRYAYEGQPVQAPAIFPAPGYGTGFSDGIQHFVFGGVALGETHIFSPKIVNQARFGYSRINAHRYPWGYQQNGADLIDLPGIPFNPELHNGGLPEFKISQYTAIGTSDDLPTVETQHTYDINDTLTWIVGQQTIKLGFDAAPQVFTIQQANSGRGLFEFAKQFTANPADSSGSGDSTASMLLGIPTEIKISNVKNIQYQRHVAGAFFQDNYKVTHRLALDLGIRWDYFGNVHELNNEMGSFDIATGTMIVPKGVTATLPDSLTSLMKLSATGSRSLVAQKYYAFAPRIGVAFAASPKLVVRSDYGMFYTGYENGPWSSPSPGYNPPFSLSQKYTTACGAPSANPALGKKNCALPGISGLSGGIPPNALTEPNSPELTALNANFQIPYMQMWQLSFQYQLPSQTLLEIAYSGSHGTHLYAFYDANQAVPSADASSPVAPRRAYPLINTGINMLSTQGFSNYNGLQARVERRLTSGLEFLASYEWQHSLDNASSGNLGSNNNSGPRDFVHDPSLSYGNSDFDMRQRFVASYFYELPFGRGMMFGSTVPTAVNEVIGGWRLSGILTLNSGQWYTANDGAEDFANNGGDNQHPDQIGNPNGKPCVSGTLFNTCAFANPPLGSLGSEGRNVIREPGAITWDTSFLKNFPITEGTHLEFRAEFFNILNHPNLTTTNLDTSSSSFGFPTDASTERQIQGALKFFF